MCSNYFGQKVFEAENDWKTFIKAVAGNLEKGWNVTVDKMRYLVLKEVEVELGCEEFERIVESIYGSDSSLPSSPSSSDSSVDSVASSDEHKQRIERVSIKSTTFNSTVGVDATIKEQMKGGKVPSTITGVAPWAFGNAGRPPSFKSSLPPQNQRKGFNPPATITGVAPWAQPSSSPSPLKPSFKKPKPTPPSPSKPSKNFQQYLTSITPPPSTSSPWSLTQLSPHPTLLPSLKFHSLVFGQTLGSGTFSTVKYARKIMKKSSRSTWDEYAVKIIDTNTVEKHSYSINIVREISVLKVMTARCFTRLVSSFRYSGKCYLVMEYCGRDLFDLVVENGSLDLESSRFVMGECAVGLEEVKRLGIVYGDFKPENVMITESGHVKIGDFGGARPYTPSAKELIKNIMKKENLSNLRNGDWKTDPEEKRDIPTSDTKESLEDSDSDYRVEGTASYLPPEVIRGSFPNFGADVWGWGCVLFFCMTGKPPLMEFDDESTMKKVVEFADGGGDIFDGEDVEEMAEEVIRGCCEVDEGKRLSIEGVIGHEWFENIDVYKLYDSTPPEMNVGKVKKGMVDEKWKRRQHSMIWSPTNERYDFDEESTSLEKGDKGEEERFLREPYYDIDDDNSGEEKYMILCDEEKEEEEKGIEGLDFIEEDEEEKGDDF
ncbi:hypothetical protein TrST_g4417 [Triparma strigata]|uniref:non-specific serine/threonine protein kinase n=1 Tax=Triparma strigata TaxID=1606541 RepID=A0A9W7F1V2_9STRA|nr:hypothetical protein TrST_g4417 [Triparma strigata]